MAKTTPPIHGVLSQSRLLSPASSALGRTGAAALGIAHFLLVHAARLLATIAHGGHLLLKGLVGRVALGVSSLDSTAARTAQPGSSWWVQSREAALRGQRLHIGKSRADALFGVPQFPSPARRHITMRPAPGTSTISRLTVVWRPAPSPRELRRRLRPRRPPACY